MSKIQIRKWEYMKGELGRSLFESSRDVITHKSISILNKSLHYIAGLDNTLEEKNEMSRELVEMVEADVADITSELTWAYGVMSVVDSDDMNILLNRVTEYLTLDSDIYLKQLNYKK